MTVFAFSKGFVFVANTRAASSTMHHILLPDSDVIFYRPEFGKHFTYPQISRRAKRMSGQDIAAFFTFGILRDPVSWLFSWYCFRQRNAPGSPSTDRTREIPGDMSFFQFIEEVRGCAPRPFAHIPNQSRYFCDPRGRVMVDYIARYETLRDDMLALSVISPLLQGVANARVNTSAKFGGKSRPPNDKTAVHGVPKCFESDAELYEKVVRGDYKRIRCKSPAFCPIELDEGEKREDMMSRITLLFSLGERAAASEYLARLDSHGRSDQRMQWIAKQTDAIGKSPSPAGCRTIDSGEHGAWEPFRRDLSS